MFTMSAYTGMQLGISLTIELGAHVSEAGY